MPWFGTGWRETPTGLQQLVGAHDIGMHSGFRTVDGTIDMRLLHDGIGGVICKPYLKQPCHRDLSANDSLDFFNFPRGEIAGVG